MVIKACCETNKAAWRFNNISPATDQVYNSLVSFYSGEMQTYCRGHNRPIDGNSSIREDYSPVAEG